MRGSNATKYCVKYHLPRCCAAVLDNPRASSERHSFFRTKYHVSVLVVFGRVEAFEWVAVFAVTPSVHRQLGEGSYCTRSAKAAKVGWMTSRYKSGPVPIVTFLRLI